MQAWRGGIKRKICGLTGPDSVKKLRAQDKVRDYKLVERGTQDNSPRKQIFCLGSTAKYDENVHEMSKDIQILLANHIRVTENFVQHSDTLHNWTAISEKSNYKQEI